MNSQMRLTEDIYLVGSAEFGISNAYDCHVYLIDGGEEAALIDCGVGYDTGQIIRNIEKYIDIEKLKSISYASACGSLRGRKGPAGIRDKNRRASK